MASPYNTRSTRSTSASSMTTVLPPRTDSERAITTTTTTSQHRYFCIVLTNNPRMIQSAQRMLQTVTLTVPVSITYIEFDIEKKTN